MNIDHQRVIYISTEDSYVSTSISIKKMKDEEIDSEKYNNLHFVYAVDDSLKYAQDVIDEWCIPKKQYSKFGLILANKILL